MGIFRKYKAKDYTTDEAVHNEGRLRKELFIWANRHDLDRYNDPEFKALLHQWAEWRELRARLEGDNESEVV